MKSSITVLSFLFLGACSMKVPRGTGQSRCSEIAIGAVQFLEAPFPKSLYHKTPPKNASKNVENPRPKGLKN